MGMRGSTVQPITNRRRVDAIKAESESTETRGLADEIKKLQTRISKCENEILELKKKK